MRRPFCMNTILLKKKADVEYMNSNIKIIITFQMLYERYVTRQVLMNYCHINVYYF